MKKITLLFLIVSYCIQAQDGSKPDDFSKYVSSLDSTITTLYNVISGDKGEERNWKLFTYLFHPDAKLIPTGQRNDSSFVAKYITPETYIKTSGKWLVENGFHEVERHREVDTFGNIAQVFSTYECFHNKQDTTPFMRGINSIQLLFDGHRWWIVNIYWMQETPNTPIPNAYLPKK